jgi:cytochrome c-type biogenesis protein CcmF
MPQLGTLTLLATFVICCYASVVCVTGARRGSRRLIQSGIGAFYLSTATLAVASAILVHAFVVGDYSIKYVAHYSDSAQPLFYKLTSWWGGLDGSIMFWTFLLAVFGSLAVFVNRERHRELIPYVVAIIGTVQMFFLFLMVIHKNPFDTFLLQTPPDGTGLNPLLQNYWMAIHPPSLYTGFVGMTIPFAFGLAALITGHLDDSWLVAVRRWTMFAWLFLSFGLVLGMIWAYEELGWGGFWAWDPVENAGALPWFTATAFLHSVMVQERRSMLRVWNVSLVIVTFFLTIFGTFMTRSGIVQSVHAFGEDRELAWMFTAFMVVILTFSFGWVIYRMPLLRARHELDSWVSREAAFLANNWILLFAALFILFGTMFPTLSEAVTGERLTVAAPFFNKWMLPIGLVLLFLTGVGPLLAWRKSTVANLRDQFLWPTAFMLVVTIALVAPPIGVRVWTSGLCFALCAFVTGTITQEFIRGARVRKSVSGADFLTAMIGLVARSRRRYGGYIVHLGIVLIFLGFAGEGFKREVQVNLRPNQQTTVGRYTVRHNAVQVSDDGQKQMVTADVTVFENGKEVGRMYPAKWYYRKHEEEPTTETAIWRRPAEDLYIVLAAFDAKDQSASIQVVVNPLVNWIWLGFGVMAIGTGIALLPERTFAFALGRLPAGAATTASMILFLLLFAAAPVRAQHVEQPQNVTMRPLTPLEERLHREVVCLCGACGHKQLSTCFCGTAEKMKDEIAQQVKAGKNHDEVIAWLVSTYGSQEPLGAPIDKGFNRLAWLVPVLAGAGGIAVIGFVAVKWSRRQEDDVATTPRPQVDPELEARLEDELRDID